MNFLERIVAGAEFRATSGLGSPAGWLLDAFGTSTAWSGEKVTKRNAMGLAAVWSAVEKISEAVGQLPLKVYRVLDDDDRVEARSHRTWRMLHDKPNPQTTARRFWSTVSAQVLLDGNSFVWKERDDEGVVESLYLIDPASVTVEWDGVTKRFVQEGRDGRRTFTDEQVLHIMGLSLDGIIGVSRIAYCRESLGTALGRARYESEFYAQGATFPGVIEYPGRLGPEGTKNLGAAMQSKHGGAGNRHKTPVLEEGATFKPVGMSLADMQFVEGAQLSRSDIATMFNLPASYLNASSGDSLTYATTESNQIQFAQMAVAPMTTTIATALTNDPGILPQNVLYAEFVLEGLLRADMKTRAEYWASMKATLGLSPEFIAARENIPQSALEEPEPVPAPLRLVPSPEQELEDLQASEARSRAATLERDERFEEMRALAEVMRPNVTVDVPATVISEGAVQVTLPEILVPAANVSTTIEEGAIQVNLPPPPAVTIEEGAMTVQAAPVPSVHVDVHQPTPVAPTKRTVEFSDGRKATISEEDA